jgi:hypothetical protein
MELEDKCGEDPTVCNNVRVFQCLGQHIRPLSLRGSAGERRHSGPVDRKDSVGKIGTSTTS